MANDFGRCSRPLLFVAFQCLALFVVLPRFVKVRLADGCVAIDTLLLFLFCVFGRRPGKGESSSVTPDKIARASINLFKFNSVKRLMVGYHTMGRTLFRLSALALVSAASASASTQDSLYTLRVDVPVVSLDVSVIDSTGKPVNNLGAEHFSVYENGVLQQVRFFNPVSAPYNVFLLFDRSGSTQHKWQFMQRAVADFIASLRTQDRLAIGSFDDEFQVHLRWTNDRSKALSAISELIRPKAIGGTNFYRALDRTLRREMKVEGRKALIVLTDGRDTALYRELVSRNRLLDASDDRGYQRAFRAAKELRVPVYFVALNTDRNIELNQQGGDEFRNLQKIFPNSPAPQQFLEQVRIRMEQISEVSGGRALYPDTIEDVIRLYEQVSRELGTSYSLGYVPSAARTNETNETNETFRRIEVRISNANLRVMQSRTGYYLR